MSPPLFDTLRRWPDVEAPELVAVDAADRLLLDEAAPALATAGADVVVVGDDYGALTLGALTRHDLARVRVHQDSFTGELAMAANAARAGIDPGRVENHPVPGPALVRGATVVLLKLPRSLEALDATARLLARHAHPDVVVLAGGRVKHMTHAMNDVLARSFAHVRAGLGRQKARVLTATSPRPDVTETGPRRFHDEDTGLWVCAVGGAFAGATTDIGTRVLLDHLDEVGRSLRPPRTVVDLGCGTGLLAAAAARRFPSAAVVATDQSADAVASARLTAAANGVADRVRVERDDAGSRIPDAGVDLVLLNPPFHVGGAVHTAIASKVFRAAARVLAPGGTLVAVWNSHLTYRRELERVVGPTRQVARTPKFTLTASTRR
ncbi:class I SAM-dependent methyltransferase [Kineococcus rhizosphaerae]|uniref:16S rRNA (Guanine1207-N2)-methyltransferase n=1 Tax=Kineococcus rhizosphaerae TaxID=559628 RepID=A0A2T0R6F9_9ACTN|nr:methyltransferase [Kineococcus rhizosphaerae]PRY16700.1 16S rRNA (guanine1207-N2)-methyltransferase [Kineococcus rhizosphaerae]